MKIALIKENTRVLAVTMIAAVALSGCATVKMHPDFSERHAKMRHIAMMPVDAEAYEITFNAGEKPLADLQALMKKKSAENIESILKGKGYEVVNVDISQEQLDKNPRLKEVWFDIQTLYREAVKDIQKGKKKEFTYDVGAGPNYFAENHQANVILLTRQRGTKLSDGMIAAQMASTIASIATTILVGVPAGGGAMPWHTLQSEIAIVDAESGDILWYNLGITTENYTKPEDTKVVANHVKQILTPLPDSKFKSQVKPSAVPAKTSGTEAKEKTAQPAIQTEAVARAVAETAPPVKPTNFGPKK